MLTLTAQMIDEIKKSTLAALVIGSLPYSSLNGARTSGPTANPMIYTETTSDESAEFLVLNSAITCDTLGAKRVDAIALDWS